MVDAVEELSIFFERGSLRQIHGVYTRLRGNAGLIVLFYLLGNEKYEL